MSEYEPLLYQPEEPENEPAMRFETDGGKELLATRFNTRLYTFLARAAFNHIFIIDEVKDRRAFGYYLWELTPDHEPNEIFNNAMTYMVENDYPSTQNSLTVPVSDVSARARYDSTSLAAETEAYLNDAPLGEDELFIPDDWTTE